MTGSEDLHATAHRALNDLVDAGALITYRAPNNSLPPSFTYELAPSGNRQRCRQLIAEAKADPIVWAELLAEIAARSKSEAAE